MSCLFEGFECRRCGDCCRWGGYVYITPEDVSRISRYLSMDEFEFVNKYAEIIERPRMNLKTKEGGGCIFLEGNDCSIQAVKPRQCVDFPGVWRIKDLESFCRGQRELKQKNPEKP